MSIPPQSPVPASPPPVAHIPPPSPTPTPSASPLPPPPPNVAAAAAVEAAPSRGELIVSQAASASDEPPLDDSDGDVADLSARLELHDPPPTFTQGRPDWPPPAAQRTPAAAEAAAAAAARAQSRRKAKAAPPSEATESEADWGEAAPERSAGGGGCFAFLCRSRPTREDKH
jgi:hypothetical protein